jgi:hypothetical protein
MVLNVGTTAQKSCSLHTSQGLSHQFSSHFTLLSTQSTIMIEVACVSVSRSPGFLCSAGQACFHVQRPPFFLLCHFSLLPFRTQSRAPYHQEAVFSGLLLSESTALQSLFKFHLGHIPLLISSFLWNVLANGSHFSSKWN